MPVGSFSFRLACYNEFGWTPDQVRALPESEAALLAIYFEETGAYQYKQNKKLSSQTTSSSRSDGEWETDLILKDPDWDDD